jgi:hypothetical protein
MFFTLLLVHLLNVHLSAGIYRTRHLFLVTAHHLLFIETPVYVGTLVPAVLHLDCGVLMRTALCDPPFNRTCGAFRQRPVFVLYCLKVLLEREHPCALFLHVAAALEHALVLGSAHCRREGS